MPVISFVSSKGGVGKTTGAVVLACDLARAGHSVVMIDADPNRPLVEWSGLKPLPDRLTVVADHSAETIMDTIKDAAARAEWVIVDLEGTASERIGFAVARSSLVLIPVRGSTLDANEAAKSIRLIRRMEAVSGRTIPFRVYFSSVPPAIREKTARDIEEQFTDAGIPLLAANLVDRAPFRSIFSLGGTIYAMTKEDVSGLPAAVQNARLFSTAVMDVLAGRREVAA